MTGTEAGLLGFGNKLGLEREESGVEPWANGDESLRASRDEVRDVIVIPLDFDLEDDEDKAICICLLNGFTIKWA